MTKMHLKKFCPLSLSSSWFLKREKARMRLANGRHCIFQISFSTFFYLRRCFFLCNFIHSVFQPCVFPLFKKSTSSLSSANPLFKFNYYVSVQRSANSTHNLAMIRWGQSVLARHSDAVKKSLREQRNESARGILHGFPLFPSCCLSDPCRPGMARGGNCIKVDVGYARTTPLPYAE